MNVCASDYELFSEKYELNNYFFAQKYKWYEVCNKGFSIQDILNNHVWTQKCEKLFNYEVFYKGYSNCIT